MQHDRALPRMESGNTLAQLTRDASTLGRETVDVGAFLHDLDSACRQQRNMLGDMQASSDNVATANARVLDTVGTMLSNAATALEQDFRPITDWRASADYRMKVSKNLLMRLYVETTDAQTQTRLVGDRSLAHV